MNVVTIRASSLAELFDCPARWEAKHLLGMRSRSSGAAHLGTSIHASTALFDQATMDGAPISADDAAGLFVDTLYNPEHEVDWEDSGPKQVERIGLTLHSRYCADIAPTQDYVGIEVTCERLEISDLGLALTGTTDRIRRVDGDRLTEKVEEAVELAVRIIAARDVVSVPMDIRSIKVEAKALTVTAKVDANEPSNTELTKSAGKLCLLVLAPNDYNDGLDGIQPARDQSDLPLAVGDLLGSPEELAKRLGGSAEDVATAAGETVEQQQDVEPEDFRAAAQPEVYGVVPYSDVCAVLARVSPSVTIDYLQSRFAIGSDAARALVVRLLDDKVIAVQSEAENPLHNTYRVTKDLDEVVSME
ncbi:PD-(D/E)XK nuclease family protein [uncultured Pseudomonas sp.]|uniref:PD-(D/E)XK nuclease family protein n=1 Tax=uncultured Pseudomonas sp. TaxID=114707 RepID=UPI0025828A90|nr:PD-(D/E)XK nuclease family protein [uncultured Pseudomonas sp.]